MSNKWELFNQLARQLGWRPYANPAKVFGWCEFFKGDESVWQCGKTKFVRAKRAGKVYYDHKYFASLEEALTAGEMDESQRNLQSA